MPMFCLISQTSMGSFPATTAPRQTEELPKILSRAAKPLVRGTVWRLRNAVLTMRVLEGEPVMNRRSRLSAFRLMSGAGALIAGIAFFAVPSQEGYASTSCSDCYVVTPSTAPASAGAGTGEQYGFRVTNNDPNEMLKSLTFTAPADFVITGASGPGGTSASTLPASSVTLNLPGNTGSAFSVHVTALAPCVAASSEVWAVSGTDSLGETDEVQWSSSPLSVSVQGQCRLLFTGQPAETAVNSDILTGFNSTGSPLAVHLFDANSDSLNPADFSANGTPVTVSIGTNPDGGTLAGTTTVNSSNGVADFGNLRINKAGVGYDLAANAPGFTPAVSARFTIASSLQPCPSNTACSASASSATTSGTVMTTSPVPGDFITASIGGVGYTCNGTYQPVADVFGFALFNAAGVPSRPSSLSHSRSTSPWCSPRVILARRPGRSATPPRRSSPRSPAPPEPR